MSTSVKGSVFDLVGGLTVGNRRPDRRTLGQRVTMKRAGVSSYGNGESAVFRTRRQPSRRAASDGSHWHVLALGAKSAELPSDSAAEAEKSSARRAPGEVLDALGDAEVFVLVEAGTEPPLARVVSIDAANYVLVFETEGMLEALAGEDAARLIVPMRGFLDYLRGRNVGLAINVGDRDHATIIPADQLVSLLPASAPTVPDVAEPPELPPERESVPAQAAEPSVPAQRLGQFSALLAPRDFPDTLHAALTDRMRRMAGMCARALLFRAHYDDGQIGFLVGLSGVGAGDKRAFEIAVSDVLTASHREDIKLEIAFLDESDPILDRVSRVGISLKPVGARS